LLIIDIMIYYQVWNYKLKQKKQKKKSSCLFRMIGRQQLSLTGA